MHKVCPNMKFVLKFIPFFILLVVFSVPFNVFAQLGDPGCSPDDPCPVDSGVIFLIAVAIIIAAGKAWAGGKHRSADLIA